VDVHKLWAIVPGVFTIFFIWAFLFGQTHALVAPNKTMLVVNRSTGLPVGGLRQPGITSIPLWTSLRYVYPSQSEYQWCPVFTPSIKNGVGVTMTICFTIDASQIDWLEQFQRYNGNEAVVTTAWQNALQDQVAIAVSIYESRDLTNQRNVVTDAILTQLKPWFVPHGITVKQIGLKDWSFTSEAMNIAYEQAQLAQTKIDVANAELQAAQIQVQTAKIRRDACTAAGLTSEAACLQYLQLQWLAGLPQAPANLVVSLGGSAPAIAFPAVQTTVTPTP
jgi:hypothetical protein